MRYFATRAALGAVALAALLPAAAQATFPGRNGALIAAFNDGSKPTVRAIDPTTGHAHSLLGCPAATSCPDFLGSLAVSSDGKTVAFVGTTFVDSRVSQTNLSVLDIGSRLVRQLPPLGGGDDGNPAWFPNAARLVFSVSDSTHGSHGLFSVRTDGSDLRHLIAYNCSEPSVSPDGRSILSDRGEDLWIMKSDGSHARRIARHSGTGSWAPDGRRIAFVDGANIVSADLNDRHRRMVAKKAFGPVWSPDGRLIAFARRPRANFNDSTTEIFTVHTAGGPSHRVLTDHSTSSGIGFSGMDWQALRP